MNNKILKRTFTVQQVEEITGITVRTVSNWILRRFIVPIESKSLGRRKKKHLFDFINLIQIEVMHLLGHGLYSEYEFCQNELFEFNRKKIKEYIETGKNWIINIDHKSYRDSVGLQWYRENFEKVSEIKTQLDKYPVSLVINLSKINDFLLKRIDEIQK